MEQAFFKYTQAEAFKKYCSDNMLTEAWMGGAAFGNSSRIGTAVMPSSSRTWA